MRISDWSSDVCSSDLQGCQRQIVARRQSDGAGLRAVGMHNAIHGQAAAIGGNRDVARRYLITDYDIAGLDDKAAGFNDAGVVQTLVQPCEIAQRSGPEDRKSVVRGKSVSVRLASGGRRYIKKKKKKKH